MDEVKLSSSQIKYLLTVKNLSETSEKIRSSDVASSLNLAKPSVHKMMNTLKGMNFINKEHYGDIELTEKGKDVASQYEQIFKVINGRLSEILGNTSETENAILAFLSEISTHKLNALMNYYSDEDL